MTDRTIELQETRPPQEKCTEFGRAIGCYRLLAGKPGKKHVAERLRDLAVASLQEVGLQRLRPAAERLMA
jgi:hypothetical protein